MSILTVPGIKSKTSSDADTDVFNHYATTGRSVEGKSDVRRGLLTPSPSKIFSNIRSSLYRSDSTRKIVYGRKIFTR